jgi:hypothetical protein
VLLSLSSANSCFTYMYTVVHFYIKLILHKSLAAQISADYLGMDRTGLGSCWQLGISECLNGRHIAMCN